MWRRALTLAALLLAAGCDSSGNQLLPTVQTSADEASDPRFAAVLSYMQHQMAEGGVPGGAIAVVVDGQLAFQAGLGVERYGEFTPVTSTTLFRAASLSKMVLAAAALRMVELGTLDLTRPITTYIPSYTLTPPLDADAITVQQLLEHTSGVPDFDVDVQCPVGPGEFATWFSTPGVVWTPPGEVWNYSNQGYSLAGWILQSAAEMPYEDVIAHLVFGPAGMTTATFDPVVATAADHADGFVQTASGAQLASPDLLDCEVTRPPGGVIASAVDYAHFAEMLLAQGAGPMGPVLTPASVAALETGRVDTHTLPGGAEQYGDGAYVTTGYYGGHAVIHHNGLLDYGYQSSLWLVPDSQLAVVVFYSGVASVPDNVSRYAIETFLQLPDGSAPDGSTSPATWGPYAGSYYDPYELGSITVDLDGGALFVSVPQRGVDAAAMTQQGGDTFAANIDPAAQLVTFFPGPCGPAQWFVTRGGVGQRQPECEAGAP